MVSCEAFRIALLASLFRQPACPTFLSRERVVMAIDKCWKGKIDETGHHVSKECMH